MSTPGQTPATCKYFDELDEILGHRPISDPAALLDSGATQEPPDPTESGTEGDANGTVTMTMVEKQSLTK